MAARHGRRPGIVRAMALSAWALLPCILGCATFPSGYTAITVADFEAMPDSVRERGMMIRLKAGTRITLAAVDDAEPDGPRFVVTPSATGDQPGRGGADGWDSPVGTDGAGFAAEDPVVACAPSFQSVGGGSYYAPGPPGTGGRWMSASSTPQVVHDPAPVLNCDAIEDRGDHVLCRCDQARAHVLDREYFCRNPGYEKLLLKPHPRLHAGYSVIDGAFEVAVPKTMIQSFGTRELLTGPGGEFGADRPAVPGTVAEEQATRSPRPAHAAFRWPYDMARMDALDEAAARSGLPLDDGDPDLEMMVERCSGAHAAELLSLCLAADGRHDLALKALENGIKRTFDDLLWTGHREAQDACFVLMLLSVSMGEIDRAVAAAGIVLHMETPDWFFAGTPVLFVPDAPHSLLAAFLARIEAPLREHWPAFIAALEARLGEAPAQHATAGAAADGATGADGEPARRLEELFRQARALGLFHRAAIAGEIAAGLAAALAAQPDDADLLRIAVEFELARFGADDRLTRAMGSAEALLRVDAAKGHRVRALVREAMGDLEGAEADLVSAAAMDPGATGQRGERGEFYVRHRMYDEAFDFFAGLADTSSAVQDPDYRFARAAVLARSRVDEGIQRLRRHLTRVAVDDKEHLGWAHLRLGRLLALAGRKKEAGVQFEAAGRHDPLLWQAGAYAEAVKRLRFEEDVVR